MVNSRAKGKRGELQARDLLRAYWHCPGCERAGQTSGTICADLMGGLPRGHAEVKFMARHGIMRHFEQAAADAKPGELPYLLLRETDTDNKTWLVAFEAERAEDFVQRFLRAMHLNESPEFVQAFVSKALHQR